MSRIALACAFLVLGVGCATKKHVRMQVDPIQQRVGQLEAKSKQTDASLGQLEQNISKVDEYSKGVESKALAAGEAARAADAKAVQAGEKASAASSAAADARSTADRGLTQTASLEKRVDGLDNFSLVATESVLFDFGKSRLTDAAKQSLTETASKIQSRRRYVIEIQGFTDRIGGREYNLELSRKRANEVVRFLTLEHKIPLHRIHVLGLGSEAPVGDDKTSEGRRQNRRVEVKIFVADEQAGKNVTATAALPR
jgi:outer membrane protein OmpA-like peptidoglycan-associated protein